MHEAALLDCARAALTHWDIDIADVAVVSQSENIVFRIAAVTATATDQAFVLRLHRPGYHSLAELEAEQTWTAAQRSYLGELRDKVAALLAAIPTHSNSFGLIHADLHPGNIIVNHDQMHVIDFDDAGFGWHIYDIAVVLKNYEDQQHFDKARSALIAGYRRKRALDDATLQMLPLFLLVRALATIGWVAARPELGHSDYTAKLLNYVYANADSVLNALEN